LEAPDIARPPLWVIHVILAVDRLLPVYPDEQTFSVSDGMSQSGHGTKSLRDNPLRRAT